MNFSYNKDDSDLSFNKDESTMKETKKQSNYNENEKSNVKSNDFSPKKFQTSISNLPKFKSRTTNYNKIKALRTTKIKRIPKHTSSKDFSQRKIKIKRYAYSNKTLNYLSFGNNKINKKKSKEIMDFKKEVKPNLKKVENEILTKIRNMKFNYQNNSLIKEEIFETFTNKTNSSKKNKENKQNNSNKSNINSKFNVFNSNKENNINDIRNSIKNKNNFKYNTVILKNNITNKYLSEINKDFLNLTDYHNYNKSKNVVDTKVERLRNIKRAKPLYDSIDSDESERDNEFHGNIISPESVSLLFFDLFMFLSCIYSLFYIPLRLARTKCFCIEESKTNEILLYIIDLLYVCDFILSFFRGYYNFELKLVKNNIKIFIHYLKSDFIFDLLESIPIFTYSKYFCAHNDLHVNYCFKYNMDNYLLILSIMSNLKILKIFKVKNKKKNVTFNNFFNLFSDSYSLEKSVDNAFNFLFFFLAFHFFVCFNIFLSKQTYPNWIENLQLQDESLINIYITSCYSLIETLTTVGYGDAVCQCNAERFFQIVMLAVGVIAYSYLISSFGNLFKNESQSSINYNNNMKILEQIRIEYPNISFRLYKKLYHHIESRNMSEKKLDVNILISSLPFNLKNVLLLIMYNSIIKNFKFFRNSDNSNFIIQVLSKLVPSTRKKNEFLLYEGEMIEEIVFVKDGRLSLDAAIDMEDQESSINKYFTINFQGITSEKENKRIEEKYTSKFLNPQRIMDFENAKFELSNEVKKQVTYLLKEDYGNPSLLNEMDKKDIIKNNKIFGINILKNEPIKNEDGNYKYIKILDIRKNENFGGLYILLRRPSPLSLKVRSKFAELYLLPKKDVFSISKSYFNIWRKIYKKEYHNMISIKHKAFKILDKYVEINGIVKINPGEISKNYGWNDETIKYSSSNNNLQTYNIKNNLYTSNSPSYKFNKNINSFVENKFNIKNNKFFNFNNNEINLSRKSFFNLTYKDSSKNNIYENRFSNKDKNFIEIKKPDSSFLTSSLFCDKSNYYNDEKNGVSQNNEEVKKPISSFSKDSKNVQSQEINNNNFYKFEGKKLIKIDNISFSFKSIYKNINLNTNMKYSKDIILQEKALSYINKLIENENKSFSIGKSSNKSSKNFEDLLNLKKNNYLNVSTEKSGLKSVQFENNNLNFNSSKKQISIKNKKKHNNLKVNFSKYMKSEVHEENGPSGFLSPIRRNSPRKRRKRNSQININKISIEDNKDNICYSTKNNSIKKRYKINIIPDNNDIKDIQNKDHLLKRGSLLINDFRSNNEIKKKLGFKSDIKDDNLHDKKLIFKEKNGPKKSIQKNVRSPKFLMVNGKETDDKPKSDRDLDSKIGNEPLKCSLDYFAKEEKEHCRII